MIKLLEILSNNNFNAILAFNINAIGIIKYVRIVTLLAGLMWGSVTIRLIIDQPKKISLRHIIWLLLTFIGFTIGLASLENIVDYINVFVFLLLVNVDIYSDWMKSIMHK